jgi:hypothetical protein
VRVPILILASLIVAQSADAQTALLHNGSGALARFYLKLLCDADSHWCSYFGEPIEDCSTDFELCNLTIEGAGDNALIQAFEAVHFGCG